MESSLRTALAQDTAATSALHSLRLYEQRLRGTQVQQPVAARQPPPPPRYHRRHLSSRSPPQATSPRAVAAEGAHSQSFSGADPLVPSWGPTALLREVIT